MFFICFTLHIIHSKEYPVFICVTVLFICLVLLLLKQRTIVSINGISVVIFPFLNLSLNWGYIKTVELTTIYDLPVHIKESNIVKFPMKYFSKTGVLIETVDNNKFFIVSKKSVVLYQVISNFLRNNYNSTD
jgi:hypothetical protein